MGLRQAKLDMIERVKGGWDVAAAYLGMSPAALRNRIYEVKDQKLSDEKSLALQQLSETTHYVDAIAQASGGVFVKLPDTECENEDLMKKFNQLYVLLGNFSRDFDSALSNDCIVDKQEEAVLERDVIGIQKSASELLALIVRVYGINHRGGAHGGE
ncbi:YmfL family putative regulatory protein [Massilia sp. 9096]|uniref:YmfL family putative regulatory protein n=1 Tax=Massilia sp. 9096 TaxID=1500894 RepID=UPI0005637D9E|nr:YmfL family putative regulatory protein [Massilia sp. 9096]